MTDPRLPDTVRDLLVDVARRAGPDGSALAQQIDEAVVTRSTPTWIDVRVPLSCPRVPWADGVIPMELNPSVFDPDGEPTGTVYVWVEDGLLSNLEQPWFTDDPPTDWPPLERLVWDLPPS